MNENFLKLTNATYRLLEYFPESDPLKSRAKEKVLTIMESLVLIEAGSFEVKNKLLEDIEILLGYFKIGKNQGWVSQINYLIICNEYRKILHQNKFDEKQAKKEVIVVLDTPTKTAEKTQERTQKSSESVLEKSGALKKEPHNFIKLSDRQQKIIEFLSDKEKAQVMDLQTILPTVTKRTIRRDLDELLSSGQIIRMGEFNQVFYRVS